MGPIGITCYIGVIAAVGLATIAMLRRSNLSHWAFALGMLGFALELGLATFGVFAADESSALTRVYWSTLVAGVTPVVWLTFSLCYSRGNYTRFLEQWRIVLILTFLLPMVAFLIGGEGQFSKIARGDDGNWVISTTRAHGMLRLVCIGGSALVLMNLEQTFRAAIGTMRWRIKLVIIGLGALFVARIFACSQIVLLSRIDGPILTMQAVGVLVACLFIVWSKARVGVDEIDVYPSRALLQGSLTAILGGVYLLIIGAFSKAMSSWGGEAAFPLRAFALLLGLAGLPMLMMSDRVRQRTQRFVSQHLRRPHYDYRGIWIACAQRTSSLLRQEEVCRAVARLISENLNLLSVTIWLIDHDRRQLRLGASTKLSDEQARELTSSGHDISALVDVLQGKPAPFEMDETWARWGKAFEQPDAKQGAFPRKRVGVTLSAGGRVLGLIVVEDRVNMLPFTSEDHDLLKSMGDQVAANLLNLELSQQLMQAHELEAYHAMSTFFVHDLKNTATTLSLMIKNLPIHHSDPAFRADVLRAMGKTVQHINELTTRLAHVRMDIELKPTDVDLNDLVRQEVANLGCVLGPTVSLEPGENSVIHADPELIGKVLTNLLLNANEACEAQKRIVVATSRSNGWACVSVEDNGCGMTPEFIRDSLFRPFKTTKKSGLGIGMFQSRKIVEAHQGRLEVESSVGSGSTFRLLLPLPKKP